MEILGVLGCREGVTAEWSSGNVHPSSVESNTVFHW